MIPIPHLSLLKNKNNSNFSLVFFRLVNWREEENGLEAKISNNRNVLDSSIVDLANLGNRMLPNAKNELQKIHLQQEKLCKFLSSDSMVFQFSVKLRSPFITGLGAGHPTETGMILDRNTGVPFIPASGIKGVMRLAYSIALAKNPEKEQWLKRVRINEKQEYVEDPDGDQFLIDDNEPSLIKYFGSTDPDSSKRGQIVFLDAFPKTPPALRVDIMNPHFSKYYQGKTLPLETDMPVPIKFVTVKKETEFIFRFAVLPLSKESFDDNDKKAIEEAFRIACEEIGFGGKTAIGYGRFKINYPANDNVNEKEAQKKDFLKDTKQEIWENAILTYNPGNKTLRAEKDNKKVDTLIEDKNCVPQEFHKKLFEKKVSVTAKVVIEVEGNFYKIVEVKS